MHLLCGCLEVLLYYNDVLWMVSYNVKTVKAGGEVAYAIPIMK